MTGIDYICTMHLAQHEKEAISALRWVQMVGGGRKELRLNGKQAYLLFQILDFLGKGIERRDIEAASVVEGIVIEESAQPGEEG